MRDLITFVCDGCKRKNYTSTKNKKKTTDKLAFEEVLSGVSDATPCTRRGRSEGATRRDGGQ